MTAISGGRSISGPLMIRPAMSDHRRARSASASVGAAAGPVLAASGTHFGKPAKRESASDRTSRSPFTSSILYTKKFSGAALGLAGSRLRISAVWMKPTRPFPRSRKSFAPGPRVERTPVMR